MAVCVFQFVINYSLRQANTWDSKPEDKVIVEKLDRESNRSYGVKTKLSEMPEWQFYRIKGLSHTSAEHVFKNRDLILKEIRSSKDAVKVLTSFKGIGESTAQKLLDQVSME